MLRFQGEGAVYTLIEFARLLPGRPHKNTLHRWASKGVNGRKLRTLKVGGRTCVSERAWAEFVGSTDGAASSAHAAAEAELDKLGV